MDVVTWDQRRVDNSCDFTGCSGSRVNFAQLFRVGSCSPRLELLFVISF
jgi:hypothetical protein